MSLPGEPAAPAGSGQRQESSGQSVDQLKLSGIGGPARPTAGDREPGEGCPTSIRTTSPNRITASVQAQYRGERRRRRAPSAWSPATPRDQREREDQGRAVQDPGGRSAAAGLAGVNQGRRPHPVVTHRPSTEPPSRHNKPQSFSSNPVSPAPPQLSSQGDTDIDAGRARVCWCSMRRLRRSWPPAMAGRVRVKAWAHLDPRPTSLDLLGRVSQMSRTDRGSRRAG